MATPTRCGCNETCVRCLGTQPKGIPYKVQGPEGTLIQRAPRRFTTPNSVRFLLNVYLSGGVWYACSQRNSAQGSTPTEALLGIGYRVVEG